MFVVLIVVIFAAVSCLVSTVLNQVMFLQCFKVRFGTLARIYVKVEL